MSEMDDRPFVCGSVDCGQKFSNEDHLTAHQKRHQLNLKLPANGGTNGSNMTSIVDETPTPSRFLGKLLENITDVGLDFGEIHSLTPIKSASSSASTSNPFAETFKKASSDPKTTMKLVIHPQSMHEESLNTPSVPIMTATETPHSQSPLSSESPMEIEVAKGTRNESSSEAQDTVQAALTLSDLNGIISCSPVTTLVVKHAPAISSSCAETMAGKSITNDGGPYVIVPYKPPGSMAHTKSSVIQSTARPVATSTTVKIAAKPNTNIGRMVLPRVAPVVGHAPTAGPVYLLKLPNGNTVQLQTTNGTPPALTSLVQVPLQLTPQASVVAMPSKPSSNVVSVKPARTYSKKANEVLAKLNEDSSNNSDSNGSMSYSSKRGKRSKYDLVDDPDDRKTRSLERNREAAMRCRRKRKVWVRTLEDKAHEYEGVNDKLQKEVTRLRSEVASLKDALLQHKGCEVTVAQQKMACNENATTY